MIPLTVIHITDEEAKLFVQFQKRYAFMKLMESVGAFNIKTGKVTISFNNSEVASIDVNSHYRLP